LSNFLYNALINPMLFSRQIYTGHPCDEMTVMPFYHLCACSHLLGEEMNVCSLV